MGASTLGEFFSHRQGPEPLKAIAAAFVSSTTAFACNINANGTSVNFLTIEIFNSSLSFVFSFHLYETKATATASFSVSDNPH